MLSAETQILCLSHWLWPIYLKACITERQMHLYQWQRSKVRSHAEIALLADTR